MGTSTISNKMTWVTLDVGGQMMRTNDATIRKIPSKKIQRRDGVYQVDCDPDYFKVILMWLRFGDFSVPNHINKNLLGRIGHHFELHEFVEMLSNCQFGKWSYKKPSDRRATEELSGTRKKASHD